MRTNIPLAHQFVETIPDDLDEGTIYVSIRYATVVHLCCCGCGNEVVTPLSPTDWRLTFNGQSVSLDPSVGNWSFPCQSHYWIRRDTAIWARRWSPSEIAEGRSEDVAAKRAYFTGESFGGASPQEAEGGGGDSGLWRSIKRRLWRTGSP